MTDPAEIPKGHHGMVWVFAIAKDFADPIAQLGQDLIDLSKTEIVDLDDLKPYGFARYLTEAAGFDPDQIAADTRHLDALAGRVLLVFSTALGPEAARFMPGPDLTLIGRYGTPPDLPDLAILRATSTEGILSPQTKVPMSDARIGGMVAMAVLVIAFLLVGFVIWSAG